MSSGRFGQAVIRYQAKDDSSWPVPSYPVLTLAHLQTGCKKGDALSGNFPANSTPALGEWNGQDLLH